jgi:pyrimidine operon attenuation protein / uracil phosphoribosyltransferase
MTSGHESDQPPVLMDRAAVEAALRRMSHALIEGSPDPTRLVILGIRRRGVELAERLREEIEGQIGRSIPFGILDITLYRDDLQEVGLRPVVGESQLPLEGVEGREVVLVDDVLFTGRTVRAALNELMDWGRPSRILLAVLVEREGRELPIQADVVGHRVQLAPGGRVEVRVPEIDGRLAVEISRGTRIESGAEQLAAPGDRDGGGAP